MCAVWQEYEKPIRSLNNSRCGVVDLTPQPGDGYQGKENRRFPRINRRIPVRHRLASTLSSSSFETFENKVTRSHTKDFSVGGICIETGGRIPPGTVLEIIIEFPERPIKAVGRVAWSKALDKPDKFYAGIEYIAIEDKQMNAMIQVVAESLIESNREDEKTGLAKLKQTLTHLLSKVT